MRFEYQAKDNDGNLRSGYVVAENEARAEQLLVDNDLVILSMTPMKEDIIEKLWPFGKTVPAKEMVLFSRQLSTLVGAKVPILQALRILQSQVTHSYLRKVLGDLVHGVESGNSLSLSMSQFPEVFNNVYVNIIHSGELSGGMEKSLNYLADQLEKDYELTAKVKSAMTYPVFVLVALVVIGSLMFIFILPNLTGILEQQGGSLPPITVGLIALTHFFQGYWWSLILIFGGLYFGMRYYIRTLSGRYLWDTAKLKLPIIGPIFEKIYVARFARNLSTLVLGGIPIIKAVQAVAELVNNVIYRDIILEAADKLATGKTIAEAFSGHKEIPVIVTQMVQVGEQSATLTDILLKLAVFYEKEVDNKIATLSSLMEPIIMLVLGLAVGILVAGILLPIYNLASSAG